MKLCALIVDDQLESIKIIKAMLEAQRISCVVATNLTQANELLHQYLPHLLVIDVSLGPDENGLNWLQEIRKGTLRFLPAVMITSSAAQADVRRSIQLGVDDYIIKPADPQLLKKKIFALRKRLQEQTQSPYSWTSKNETKTMDFTVNTRINAISETGMCLSSFLSNRQPISFEKFQSAIFSEIGVTQPKKLTFLNYERESNMQSGLPMRNYCQSKGWTEADFKEVRLWIRRSKLSRSF